MNKSHTNNNSIVVNHSESSLTKNEVLDNLTKRIKEHQEANKIQLDDSNPFMKFVG